MVSEARAVWQQEAIVQHSLRLLQSFHHWTGTPLLPATASKVDQAQALFQADFVVVSHGTEADPILNYGNQMALDLWQMDWSHLIQMPSRLTAEPVAWQERAQLLAQAEEQGYINNYQGVRITSNGRRFSIQNALIWNVIDEQGQRCGQAATFSQWQWL